MLLSIYFSSLLGHLNCPVNEQDAICIILIKNYSFEECAKNPCFVLLSLKMKDKEKKKMEKCIWVEKPMKHSLVYNVSCPYSKIIVFN